MYHYYYHARCRCCNGICWRPVGESEWVCDETLNLTTPRGRIVIAVGTISLERVREIL